MNQLEIVHKKISTSNKNQNAEQVKEVENMREVRGASLSRNVLRIIGSDSYYCKSESKEIWYFVRYEVSWSWCSCFDNSIRHVKCKHIFAIEYAIRKGTLRDVDKLPLETKRFTNHKQLVENGPSRLESLPSHHTTTTRVKSSFKDDSYSF